MTRALLAAAVLLLTACASPVRAGSLPVGPVATTSGPWRGAQATPDAAPAPGQAAFVTGVPQGTPAPDYAATSAAAAAQQLAAERAAAQRTAAYRDHEAWAVGQRATAAALAAIEVENARQARLLPVYVQQAEDQAAALRAMYAVTSTAMAAHATMQAETDARVAQIRADEATADTTTARIVMFLALVGGPLLLAIAALGLAGSIQLQQRRQRQIDALEIERRQAEIEAYRAQNSIVEHSGTVVDARNGKARVLNARTGTPPRRAPQRKPLAEVYANGELIGMSEAVDPDAGPTPEEQDRESAVYILELAMTHEGPGGKRIPTDSTLGIDSKAWMACTDLLVPLVEKSGGRGHGTFIRCREYPTIGALRDAILSGAVTVGAGCARVNPLPAPETLQQALSGPLEHG